jgi:hypothetical protein
MMTASLPSTAIAPMAQANLLQQLDAAGIDAKVKVQARQSL